MSRSVAYTTEHRAEHDCSGESPERRSSQPLGAVCYENPMRNIEPRHPSMIIPRRHVIPHGKVSHSDGVFHSGYRTVIRRGGAVPCAGAGRNIGAVLEQQRTHSEMVLVRAKVKRT